jgi:hypothetical protein
VVKAETFKVCKDSLLQATSTFRNLVWASLCRMDVANIDIALTSNAVGSLRLLYNPLSQKLAPGGRRGRKGDVAVSQAGEKYGHVPLATDQRITVDTQAASNLGHRAFHLPRQQ